MTVTVTAAQAKKLGLDVKAPRARTRKTASGPYRTRCVDCDEKFTTRAAETRHVAPGHTRYELILR